jgi:excisionase family DNA binding protein
VSAHPDATDLQPTAERGRIAYTVAEVAAMLGKHPNTIYEWVQRGALPAEKLGGTIYVPKWALARLLSPSPAAHEQPAPAAAPAGAGGERS